MLSTTFVRHQAYKNLMLIIGIVLMGQLPPHKAIADDIPDTYGNRIAAAERYLQTTSMKDMIHSTIKETAKNVPEDVRTAYVELMIKHTRIAPLERAALASMAKHFTVEELNALADFYGSQVGKSAMGKFGAYIGDIMPTIQQEMLKTQSAIRSELEAAIKK